MLYRCKECGLMSFKRSDFIEIYNHDAHCKMLVCISCLQTISKYDKIKTEYSTDCVTGNYDIDTDLKEE
jgi:hypothetical protein